MKTNILIPMAGLGKRFEKDYPVYLLRYPLKIKK